MQGGKTIKQKKCRVCKTLFTPYSSLTKWCSPDCGVKLSKRILQRKADKIHREKKREFRKNDKSIQRKAAQQAFNAFIRKRDGGLGCVSCDKPSTWGGQWHASHYKTTGARPDLRFNEDNCHKSCSECNNFLSGNLAEYRIRLIQRIGLERVEALENVESKTARPKVTATFYREIAEKYRKTLRELNANRDCNLSS